MEETVLKDLWQSVIDGETEKAERAAKRALELGMNPYKAIVEGLTPAINEMGERFERQEIFIPHLVMAGDAMTAGVKILEKGMSKEELKATRKGKLVLGTVKGDVHDIGKSIVGTMLKASGYEVIDLGIEIEASKFIEEAERSEADIVGASALMTTTAVYMKVITEYMEMEGVRDKYKVIFGGGALTENWAKEMGADGYAADAVKAVDLIDQMMDSKSSD